MFEQRRVIGRSTWFPKGRQIFAKETVYVSAADPHKSFAEYVLAVLASDASISLADHTVQYGYRRFSVPKAHIGAPKKSVQYVSIRLAFAGADEAARAAQFLNRRILRSRATIGVCKNIEVVDCRVENIGALLQSMYACA